MQIIDKNKDFYDFLQFQYGIDKSRTYDRRGSIILTQSKLIKFLLGHNDKLFISDNTKYGSNVKYDIQFILECGNIQYVIKIEDIKALYNAESIIEWEGKYILLKEFNEFLHLFDATPISIFCLEVNRTIIYKSKRFNKWFNWKKSKNWNDVKLNDLVNKEKKDNIKKNPDKLLINPILKDSKIPSIIPAEKIMQGLELYFSSLNEDKTINISLTDNDKLINHGFDKRWSFRH
jgi:hypothetical protein